MFTNLYLMIYDLNCFFFSVLLYYKIVFLCNTNVFECNKILNLLNLESVIKITHKVLDRFRRNFAGSLVIIKGRPTSNLTGIALIYCKILESKWRAWDLRYIGRGLRFHRTHHSSCCFCCYWWCCCFFIWKKKTV